MQIKAKPERVSRQQISEQIREQILNGDLPPGSRLRQQHLAKQFGVAHCVVREALLELKAVGLVEIVPNLE